MIKRILCIVLFLFVLSFVPAFADPSVVTPAGLSFAAGLFPSDNLVLVSADTSTVSIRASNSSGLKSVVLGLIGDYDTTVTDYTYQNQQGYTQHSIEIEQDWSWILTCVLFIVVLFCTFRLIGGFICKR